MKPIHKRLQDKVEKLNLTNKLVYLDLIDYIIKNNLNYFETIFNILLDRNLNENIIELYLKIKAQTPGVRYEKLVLKYGEAEGLIRWNSYREKQRYKNTLEAKMLKYNWTKEDFVDFNKTRAITKSNLLLKYGEAEGLIRWNSYREKQAYTNKLPYFIEKHGEVEGTLIYQKICKAKGFGIEGFETRFGKENAEAELIKHYSNYKTLKHHSLISQELFDELDKELSCINCNTYYSTKNKEFHKYDSINRKSYFYDYVIPDLKLCIEYNGDLWHANPKKYMPNEIPKSRGNKKTAKEIWECDNIKNDLLIKLGFNVLIVWDSDYMADKKGTILKLKEYIDELYKDKKLYS